MQSITSKKKRLGSAHQSCSAGFEHSRFFGGGKPCWDYRCNQVRMECNRKHRLRSLPLHLPRLPPSLPLSSCGLSFWNKTTKRGRRSRRMHCLLFCCLLCCVVLLCCVDNKRFLVLISQLTTKRPSITCINVLLIQQCSNNMIETNININIKVNININTVVSLLCHNQLVIQ